MFTKCTPGFFFCRKALYHVYSRNHSKQKPKKPGHQHVSTIKKSLHTSIDCNRNQQCGNMRQPMLPSWLHKPAPNRSRMYTYIQTREDSITTAAILIIYPGMTYRSVRVESKVKQASSSSSPKDQTARNVKLDKKQPRKFKDVIF